MFSKLDDLTLFLAPLLPAPRFRCGRCSVSCRRAGVAGTLCSCRFSAGQAVLQAGVAELVDGPDRAQDAAAAGVFKEPYETNWGAIRCSELREREGG